MTGSRCRSRPPAGPTGRGHGRLALALAPFPSAGIAPGLATWLAVGAVILLLAWFANLYNFMDGADGLAGLMALVGFLTYALLAPADSLMATACTALAGASAGFLALNWPPARVFMGDSGSVPLGFLAGGLGLAGAAAGYWPWWTPLGVFLPFVLDASVTLARRALTGRRIWEAHREHVYQRLILRGWSHQRVSLVYGGWMLACSLATATDAYPDKVVSIAAWAVIILCYPLLLRLGSEKPN
ncbi:MAG: glycosyl transferase [Burkholderiaceae bacterium]